jgi:hypothetical protein
MFQIALGALCFGLVSTLAWAVFSGWLLGSGAGGYAGVAGSGRLRPLLASALLRTRR